MNISILSEISSLTQVNGFANLYAMIYMLHSLISALILETWRQTCRYMSKEVSNM